MESRDPKHYSDAELTRFLAEDKQAGKEDLPTYALVIGKYSPRLYVYAWRKLNHAHDSEDAVQQSFINAYYDLRFNFSIEQILTMNLGGYLYTITRNEIYQIIIKRKRPQRYGITSIDALEKEELDALLYSTSTRMISIAETVERSELFKAAFKRLSMREQRALFLAFNDDMRYQDIARELNLTVSGVKALIRRARIKLFLYLHEAEQ